MHRQPHPATVRQFPHLAHQRIPRRRPPHRHRPFRARCQRRGQQLRRPRRTLVHQHHQRLFEPIPRERPYRHRPRLRRPFVHPVQDFPRQREPSRDADDFPLRLRAPVRPAQIQDHARRNLPLLLPRRQHLGDFLRHPAPHALQPQIPDARRQPLRRRQRGTFRPLPPLQHHLPRLPAVLRHHFHRHPGLRPAPQRRPHRRQIISLPHRFPADLRQPVPRLHPRFRRRRFRHHERHPRSVLRPRQHQPRIPFRSLFLRPVQERRARIPRLQHALHRRPPHCLRVHPVLHPSRHRPQRSLHPFRPRRLWQHAFRRRLFGDVFHRRLPLFRNGGILPLLRPSAPRQHRQNGPNQNTTHHFNSVVSIVPFPLYHSPPPLQKPEIRFARFRPRPFSLPLFLPSRAFSACMGGPQTPFSPAVVRPPTPGRKRRRP